MATNEIHEFDIGTELIVTISEGAVPVDVSTASVKDIVLTKPDGVTNVTKTAIFDSDGIDGKVKYVTILNDLDAVGQWKIQAIITLSTGKWSSDIGSFRVYKNL